MKRSTATWAAGSVLLLASCASGPSERIIGVDTRFGLTEVQRPAEVAERWGEYAVSAGVEGSVTYEDELVKADAYALSGSFYLELTNLSEHSIRVLWDDASYVGPDGVASAVVSGETTFANIGTAQPPAVIPTGARAELMAFPSSGVNRVEQTVDDFFPPGTSCASAAGGSVRLILPLEIQGVPNEYSLTFTVVSVERVLERSRSGGHPANRGEPVVRNEPC